MSLASRNARRASELLAVLASNVARPRVVEKRPVRKAEQGHCSWCKAPVTWCSLPSGARAPIEADPSGDLVLDGGVAREAGPLHDGLKRFRMHFGSCTRRT